MFASVSFVSLGCDKNLVDSEVMLGILKDKGYIITDDETTADIIVINTCAFIEDALNESIENIIEIAANKKAGARIIAAGCLTERYREEMFKNLPEVDVIVGATSYEAIGEAVQSALKLNSIQLADEHIKTEYFYDADYKFDEKLSQKRIPSIPGNYYAYLKISEGCDNHCTYCIIPGLRGKYRSRTIESLVSEATELSKAGISELIIVAQDTSVYGIDLYGEIMLSELLNSLSSIEGIKWIRLMYCYPESITDKLIKTIAENDKICNYIDMPIQHISDKVLIRMGRKTSSVQIKDTIRKLRAKISDIVIRTSLISGFPGETEEDHKELLEFVKEYKIDRVGVFAFSKEEGTPAYKLPDQIPKRIRNSRRKKILEASKVITEEINKKAAGEKVKVIIEGKFADSDFYIGRSFGHAPAVDPFIYVHTDSELLTGDFVYVTIIAFFEYDLIGEYNEHCE